MIAMGYRAHGVASEEVIGEGCVGLMRTVCRFYPDRGVRFGTYAMWWVCAIVLEYILRDTSWAKKATTASRKKLFFDLQRMHGHLRNFDDGTRMARTDGSLNVPIGVDSLSEWLSWPVNDEDDDQKATLVECDEPLILSRFCRPH